MKDKHAEAFADRRDYRKALIERRNGIDAKIARVEEQIKKLTERK